MLAGSKYAAEDALYLDLPPLHGQRAGIFQEILRESLLFEFFRRVEKDRAAP